MTSVGSTYDCHILPSLTGSAVGKTLAFTSINFRNAKGEIVARGSHTKYVTITID